MNYSETIEYLYNSTPLFQNVGKAAYKEGLANTFALDEHLGHPHQSYRTIHIAGTNGKGSCSHTIAAILQSAGYKVGLFTSPHLVDFRERIRVNGEMISEQYVVDFVAQHKAFFEPLHPSFFELTTAMAFKYFEESRVDVAVIEVGLGGRLDCTNIITPELSVITNISFDHIQFLGDTLAKIACEKAGIIKAGVPVVIGESHPETRPVFEAKACDVGASSIMFADDKPCFSSFSFGEDGTIIYKDSEENELLRSRLGGLCQLKNTNTILHAIKTLCLRGFNIEEPHVINGFLNVCTLTGLMGRWQIINEYPKTVCDTGHNIGGFQYITRQLALQKCKVMRIVLGMVNDKDINGVLSLLPKDAVYYFTQASVKRALSAGEVSAIAAKHDLHGSIHASVIEAYTYAKNDASDDDFIYVGGSSFIVADLLSAINA